MQLRKLIREVLSKNISLSEGDENKLICYHRSNELQHMENNDFSLELSANDSIFGKAIYFSESPNISSQLGKYLCKFKIKLDSPVLNLNQEMTNEQANILLQKFNKLYNTNIEYDFNYLFEGVQYGEFFLELQEFEMNAYFTSFIKHMGYNSFVHYCDYGTNFITKPGDYGKCYGIYNTSNIEFVDGPF